MRKTLRSFFYSNAVLILLLIYAGCANDQSAELVVPVNNGTDTLVRFKSGILPILQDYCALAGCHVSVNTGNFPLENYQDVLNYGGVAAGLPLQSDFYDVLQTGYMPQGATLSQNKIDSVYHWILQGALNN